MYTLTQSDEHSFARDVYVLDLVRLPSGRDGSGSNVLASISSDGRLSVLDAAAGIGRGPVSGFDAGAVHGNVTVLRAFGGGESSGVVCTAGENGTVGVWDLRAGRQVVQFQACQKPVTAMACNPHTHTIAVGTELVNHEASIHLWDVRSSPSISTTYNDLHSDDITTLTYHPSNPSVLLSGSTDGLVNVCDTSIQEEDDVVARTLNLNASVHHAGFLGPAQVYALSHDEQFAIYDIKEGSEDEADVVRDFGDVRQAIDCRYVADVVAKVDGTGAIVGAGAQDQQMFELVFLNQTTGTWEMDRGNSVGLPGAHGEEIVRAFCFFDKEQVVFTAGEDGNIKAWRPGG